MSYLLLYGENLKLYNNGAISTTPYNIAYSDVIAANSSIWTTYKNGFIPNTGASGVMLNTVLKQNSYAANVMQNTYRNLFSADIYDAPLSVQTQLEQNIITLVNYVGQIRTLLFNNTIIPDVADYAVNYTTSRNVVKTIRSGFDDIYAEIQHTNGETYPTIFNTAKDYYDGNDWSPDPPNSFYKRIKDVLDEVTTEIQTTQTNLNALFSQSSVSYTDY